MTDICVICESRPMYRYPYCADCMRDPNHVYKRTRGSRKCKFCGQGYTASAHYDIKDDRELPY